MNKDRRSTAVLHWLGTWGCGWYQ